MTEQFNITEMCLKAYERGYYEGREDGDKYWRNRLNKLLEKIDIDHSKREVYNNG